MLVSGLNLFCVILFYSILIVLSLSKCIFYGSAKGDRISNQLDLTTVIVLCLIVLCPYPLSTLNAWFVLSTLIVEIVLRTDSSWGGRVWASFLV